MMKFEKVKENTKKYKRLTLNIKKQGIALEDSLETINIIRKQLRLKKYTYNGSKSPENNSNNSNNSNKSSKNKKKGGGLKKKQENISN